MGPTIDIQKFYPDLMIRMYFALFIVERIYVFTSTFMALCSATSYQFSFTPRSKIPPLDILKLLVATLREKDKKCPFIRVYKHGALAISSKLMQAYHNMNTIVQETVGDESSLN